MPTKQGVNGRGVLELAVHVGTRVGWRRYLATPIDDPYLKYALFCRSTHEADGELDLNGIIDLVDLPEPSPGQASENLVLAEVDVNLALCIGGVAPGEHMLFVALKTPGIPLETPPAQRVQWDEGILFQRWIKTFRIPVQAPGTHSAAILFDGTPLGEATFLVRFKPE